jgi:hypothetical protein
MSVCISVPQRLHVGVDFGPHGRLIRLEGSKVGLHRAQHFYNSIVDHGSFRFDNALRSSARPTRPRFGALVYHRI